MSTTLPTHFKDDIEEFLLLFFLAFMFPKNSLIPYHLEKIELKDWYSDKNLLILQGFTGLTDMAGGYAAWTQNGLPTEL